MSDFSVNANTKTRPADALTMLWGFLTSGRWVALLLALFALTVFLYALWPYLVVNNSNTFSDMPLLNIDSMGVQEGRFLSIEDNLSLYRALWFRFLLGLMAFTLLLRLLDRFQFIFYPGHYLSRIPSLYFNETAYTETVESELTCVDIENRLKHSPYSRWTQVWQFSQEVRSFIYAGNLRSIIWGDSLLHLGCLLVILGLFITAQWGWYDENILLAAGESHELGQPRDYTLTVDSVDTVDSTLEASFELVTPDGLSEEYSLSMFKPYLSPQVAVFHTGSGPAFELSVRDREENRLLLQPLVRGSESASSVSLKFQDFQNDGYLFIPEPAITIRVDRYQSLPEEGYDSPVYLVRAYRGNQSSPLFSRYVEQDEEFEWQELTYVMELGDYVTLNVVSDFGWWFVLLGLMILVAGGVLRFAFSPWLVCYESETEDEEIPGLKKLTCWHHPGSKIDQVQTIELLLRDSEDITS